MKHCPQCNRTYADDTTTFCLEDGRLLSAPFDPAATLQMPSPRSTFPPATEILPAFDATPTPPPAPAKNRSKAIYFIGAVFALAIIAVSGIILVPRLTRPQEVSRPNPVGSWQGEWTSPLGTAYTAKVILEKVGAGNEVQGQINWTLKSANSGPLQAKIGKTGVEYIRGKYNPETGNLEMEGYREDDPNDIINPDQYQLVLGNDGATLKGSTYNHGGWRGRLSLFR